MRITKQILIIMCLCSINLIAAGPLDFGFKVGMSVPSGDFDKVYGNLTDTSKSNLLSKITDQASSGYHLGVTIRTTLLPLIDLYGGFGIHRFTQNTLTITDPTNPSKTFPQLNTVQNIIPISAGINFNVFNMQVVKIYLNGEVDYNYITYSTDVKIGNSSTAIPISYQESEVQNRMGYGFGIGAEGNLVLVKFFLEAKINQPNLIGRPEGEELKKFYSLTAGIYF